MPLIRSQTDLVAIEQGVLDIIRGLLRELGSEQRVRIVAPDSTLERDLGLGSLERLELLVRCERRFGRRLPDDLAQQAETPSDWVRALAASEVSLHLEEAQRKRYRIEQPPHTAPEPPASARTWVEVLRYHAGLDPDCVQIHLLEGDSGQDISYGKLLE